MSTQSAQHPSSIRQQLREDAPLIAAVSLIILALSQLGWLSPLETQSLDAWMRLKAPIEARCVSIVKITEGDYERLFESRSPLAPEKLKDIIRAIASGGARLIAVDIDTSHKDFAQFQPEADWPTLVWAQSASYAPGNEPESDRIRPKPILGAQNRCVPMGLALFPNGTQGGVRYFRHAYETADGPVLSFPAAIVEAWHALSAEKKQGDTAACPDTPTVHDEEGHNLILDLSGGEFTFNPHKAGEVLHVADSPAWRSDGLLKHQLVILGGEYDAARDFHETPMGRKLGVELIAHAVEAELQGRMITPVNHSLMVALEVTAGLCMSLLHFYLGTTRWRWLVVVAIPAIALSSSWLAFARLSLWANFAPVMVAVHLHHNPGPVTTWIVTKLRYLPGQVLKLLGRG
ncbi:MAG: CHASE2 domain-containing protein [Gammaproteobacteria bacterium]